MHSSLNVNFPPPHVPILGAVHIWTRQYINSIPPSLGGQIIYLLAWIIIFIYFCLWYTGREARFYVYLIGGITGSIILGILFVGIRFLLKRGVNAKDKPHDVISTDPCIIDKSSSLSHAFDDEISQVDADVTLAELTSPSTLCVDASTIAATSLTSSPRILSSPYHRYHHDHYLHDPQQHNLSHYLQHHHTFHDQHRCSHYVMSTECITRLSPTADVSQNDLTPVSVALAHTTYMYIQGVPNWYLHFQIVITEEQKIVQCETIHQKKVKIMPFYIIKILFENNIREMITIIFNTNVETRECIFINFLQHFPFKFYRFLPVFNFLMLAYQEQMLKTRLPLDAPARKKNT